MKVSLPFFTTIIILAAFATAQAEEKNQAVEKKVALRNTAGKPQTYATILSKGGLNISSVEIASRQVFTLVDANGGELADGDDVQIKTTDGDKPTYWYETSDGKVGRIGRADKSTHFKLKKTDKGISLQAPSGKFVSPESKDNHLVATDEAEKAVVFEVVENPAVKVKETTEPKGTESPKEAGDNL